VRRKKNRGAPSWRTAKEQKSSHLTYGIKPKRKHKFLVVRENKKQRPSWTGEDNEERKRNGGESDRLSKNYIIKEIIPLVKPTKAPCPSLHPASMRYGSYEQL